MMGADWWVQTLWFLITDGQRTVCWSGWCLAWYSREEDTRSKSITVSSSILIMKRGVLQNLNNTIIDSALESSEEILVDPDEAHDDFIREEEIGVRKVSL